MEQRLYKHFIGSRTSEALKLLEDSDVNEWINKQVNGFTCLWWACKNNNKAIVNKIKQSTNVDINRLELSGCSALHFAAHHRHTNIVELLLEHGAVCQGDDYNFTPLHYAAYHDDTYTLKCLLDNSRKHTNTKSTYSTIPRFKSLSGFFFPIVCPTVGSTALHTAAYHGHMNATKLLIRYDADTTIKAEGKTPYDLAVERKHQAVADYLKQISEEKSTTDKLVRQVKDLEIKCDQLQSQNNKLERENQDLKARVSKLEGKAVKSKTNNLNNQKAKAQCVKKNRVYLVNNMCAHDHLDYLLQEEALSTEDYQVIRKKEGDINQTREMVDRLTSKKTTGWVKVLQESMEKSAKHLLYIFN